MKALLTTASFTLFYLIGHTQTCQWAESLGSTNTMTRVAQVKPYTGTDVLICGSFAAPSLVLGGHSLSNNGQDDGYMALADAAGEYLWATRIGGGNNDNISDVAAHANGEFVAVGNFRSVFLTVGDTTLSNNGESDVFITKFNSDRTIAWVRQSGSLEIEEATNVRIDQEGNIYVSGQMLNRITQQTIHIFVRKYAPNGSLLWEGQGITESGAGYASALALDNDQNAYCSGWFYGTLTFGSTTLTANEGYAAYIAKYDAGGNLLTSMMTADLGELTTIATHGNDVYACARRMGFGIGWGWPLSDSKVHVMKFDADLNTIWSRDFGGEVPNHSLDLAKGLSVDAEGNAYVTGSYFSDTLFFADDTLINPYNAPYYYPQIFVAKYSAAGDEEWGLSAGGIHSDEATSIHAVGNDQFYLAGNFESDPTDFGAFELHNTSQLDTFYVHLYPARYGRKTMGFLAKFEAGTTTIIEDGGGTQFTLWPNPASNSITIRPTGPFTASFRIQLCALDGRVIQDRIHAPAIEIHHELTDLAPGPYLLTILSESGRSTRRFIKH